jgi:hypothetical protein
VDEWALVAWLRQGERQAQELRGASYARERFTRALQAVRTLTARPPEEFQPQVTEICAGAGVLVVFVPRLEKVRLPVNGAARWLSADRALIQLTLRYPTDDVLWFTFFHEAGHVLLHNKKPIVVDLESGGGSSSAEEIAADRFAADQLIPPDQLKSFLRATSFTPAHIKEFAAELGIAPGIVVGRLQHDRHLPHSYCNDLKRKLKWSN